MGFLTHPAVCSAESSQPLSELAANLLSALHGRAGKLESIRALHILAQGHAPVQQLELGMEHLPGMPSSVLINSLLQTPLLIL